MTASHADADFGLQPPLDPLHYSLQAASSTSRLMAVPPWGQTGRSQKQRGRAGSASAPYRETPDSWLEHRHPILAFRYPGAIATRGEFTGVEFPGPWQWQLPAELETQPHRLHTGALLQDLRRTMARRLYVLSISSLASRRGCRTPASLNNSSNARSGDDQLRQIELF